MFVSVTYELPEFSRNVLEEVQRQPLEERQVTVARARAIYTFPAEFIFAVSMNPYPCGFFGSETPAHGCICSPLKNLQYPAKISGPLLDQIDLHVEVVPRMDNASIRKKLSSKQMLESVLMALILFE